MILTHKGAKINYNTAGKGKTIVFLHGFIESAAMWEETMNRLSHKYHCIAIDLLGHGKTECIGYIHTMEDMAHAVKAVLDHLKVTSGVFVGHSMGGYVALACIDLFPTIVSGLVMLNSTSYPDSTEKKQNRKRAITLVKSNPNSYTSMVISFLFAEKHRKQYALEINTIKDQASKTSLQGIIAALEGVSVRKDRGMILANYKGPKVFFVGDKDPIFSYEHFQKETKQYGIDMVTFNGGHMTYLENKEEYIQNLIGFLSLC